LVVSIILRYFTEVTKTIKQMSTQTQTIVRVSRIEMKQILSETNVNQFISMVSKTPQKMNDYSDYWLMIDGKRKKNPNPTPNPFLPSGIYKEQYKIDVLTGFGNYDDIIVKRLKKEGKSEEVINDFINRHEIKKEQKRVELREKHPDWTDEQIEEEIERTRKEVWWTPISNSLVTDKRTESKFYLRYVYTERTHDHTDTFTHEGNEVDRQIFQDFLTKKNTDSYSSQGLDHTFNIQFVDLEHIVELTMNGTKYILTN
jgi:hypothetical protein